MMAKVLVLLVLRILYTVLTSMAQNTYMGEAQLNDIYSNWRVWARYYRHHLLGGARGGDEVMATYDAKAWEAARAQAREEEEERKSLTDAGEARKSSRGSDRGSPAPSPLLRPMAASARGPSPLSLDGLARHNKLSAAVAGAELGAGAGSKWNGQWNNNRDLGTPPPTSPAMGARRISSHQPERDGVS
jgi:hypothetical protein